MIQHAAIVLNNVSAGTVVVIVEKREDFDMA